MECTSEQSQNSIWSADKHDAPTDQTTILDACLQWCDKAHGHINAIERKLWHDINRGIWSANQAKARSAEILLFLRDSPREIPVIERYIHKDKLPELLKALEDIFPSYAVLQEVNESEAAILAEPFPILGLGSMNHEERLALNSGIARQYRYIKALWGLLEVTEEAVAERFLALRVGDWLKVHDGNAGVICSIRGLTVQVFIPAWATGDLLQAMRLYWLVRSHLVPIPAQRLPVLGPAHYWLSLSRNLLQSARHLVHNTNELKAARDIFIQVLDATAKTWWLANIPGERQVSWGHCQLRNVHLLHGKAPQAVAGILSGAASRIEYLSGWTPNARIAKPDENWALQLAIMIEAVTPVLTDLESDISAMRYELQNTNVSKPV